MSLDPSVLKEGTEKKRYVRRMFNAIAPRYDLLNHLLSFGFDIFWRRKAVRMLEIKPEGRVLDLACGTGDVALTIVRQKKCRVVGCDLARNMLTIARSKAKKYDHLLSWIHGDGESLPFPDAVFDALTIAFGIRNMAHLQTALQEMYRVLKLHGQLMILEFSLPAFTPFRWLYLQYFLHLLPMIGRAISGDPGAYKYLPESVSKFPHIEEFVERLEKIGFKNVSYRRLFNGVAVIYLGRR